jgi:SAM-dependent methyltransferase
MISPVTLNENTTLVRTIKTDYLIDLYKKAINIDISYIKNSIKEINLYRCNDSGYQFYTPFNAAGDGSFYAELSKQSWYYSYTRWEHQKALELVPPIENLLEMGCGSGYFLELLKKNRPGIKSVGLEINEDAIEEGKSKGLNIVNENVISYSKQHPGEFDFVCSFQVMEHIYNVREVLEAQLNLLKKGGYILIAVPNNDSYVGRNQHVSRCLNMPPHHMGLWSNHLFNYIEKEFQLINKGIFTEPFSDSAYEICHFTNVANKLGSEFLTKLYFKTKLHLVFKNFFLKKYRKTENGHTILALFQKSL